MTNTVQMRALALAATQGEWQVIETEHPCRLGKPHIERRIFTLKNHPQLMAPFPVVNQSLALGTEETGNPHIVQMSAEDAAYIAALSPPVILALLDHYDRMVDMVDDLTEALNRRDA